MTELANNSKSMGYWQRVARDGPRMGFWFILPDAATVGFYRCIPTSDATVSILYMVDTTRRHPLVSSLGSVQLGRKLLVHDY